MMMALARRSWAWDNWRRFLGLHERVLCDEYHQLGMYSISWKQTDNFDSKKNVTCCK
jgi:hypothetical protein